MRFEHVPAVLAQPHGLLEGPCVAGESIVFSDVLAGGVLRLTASGAVEEVLPRRRGIGGIAATEDGSLIVTGRDVVIVDAAGRTETLYEDPGAAGFNDIGTCRDGSVIVGVLRYRPLAGEQPQPGELVRIAADGSAEVVAGGFIWPNGLVECEDGALLASDFARGHVKRVGADGRGETFFELERGAPDGLALDAEGCLWIATGHGGTLVRVSPTGDRIEEIDVPARFVSSLCFAGSDLSTLVVTTADNLETPETGGSILRAASPVAGAPVPLVLSRAQAFVVEASLALAPDCDPRAPGGAVTVELCGHWEHEGPCRWPHNSALDEATDPATFRTIFVADRPEAPTVAGRIEQALRAGTAWDVAQVRERPLNEDERELAERLRAGPRAQASS